jgi:hypothetical protein
MTNKTLTLKTSLILKDGRNFPPGTTFTIESFDENNKAVLKDKGGKQFKLKAARLHIYFVGLKKAPSMKTLERQSNDGYCTTVFGHKTEPDGHGLHGEPSWLLALGMI